MSSTGGSSADWLGANEMARPRETPPVWQLEWTQGVTHCGDLMGRHIFERGESEGTTPVAEFEWFIREVLMKISSKLEEHFTPELCYNTGVDTRSAALGFVERCREGVFGDYRYQDDQLLEISGAHGVDTLVHDNSKYLIGKKDLCGYDAAFLNVNEHLTYNLVLFRFIHAWTEAENFRKAFEHNRLRKLYIAFVHLFISSETYNMLREMAGDATRLSHAADPNRAIEFDGGSNGTMLEEIYNLFEGVEGKVVHGMRSSMERRIMLIKLAGDIDTLQTRIYNLPKPNRLAELGRVRQVSGCPLDSANASVLIQRAIVTKRYGVRFGQPNFTPLFNKVGRRMLAARNYLHFIKIMGAGSVACIPEALSWRFEDLPNEFTWNFAKYFIHMYPEFKEIFASIYSKIWLPTSTIVNELSPNGQYPDLPLWGPFDEGKALSDHSIDHLLQVERRLDIEMAPRELLEEDTGPR